MRFEAAVGDAHDLCVVVDARRERLRFGGVTHRDRDGFDVDEEDDARISFEAVRQVAGPLGSGRRKRRTGIAQRAPRERRVAAPAALDRAQRLVDLRRQPTILFGGERIRSGNHEHFDGGSSVRRTAWPVSCACATASSSDVRNSSTGALGKRASNAASMPRSTVLRFDVEEHLAQRFARRTRARARLQPGTDAREEPHAVIVLRTVVKARACLASCRGHTPRFIGRFFTGIDIVMTTRR